MTQKQYDKQQETLKQIKKQLKDCMINPEEAFYALIIDLHFGKTKAIELVDEWGKDNFVPYSVWSKTSD